MEVSDEILKAVMMDQVPQGPIYSSPRQVTTSKHQSGRNLPTLLNPPPPLKIF